MIVKDVRVFIAIIRCLIDQFRPLIIENGLYFGAQSTDSKHRIKFTIPPHVFRNLIPFNWTYLLMCLMENKENVLCSVVKL